MQIPDEKKRWRHNLSLDPVQMSKPKNRRIYRQPFNVLTLQDKIKLKLASINEAEKVERYTRANVLFSRF